MKKGIFGLSSAEVLASREKYGDNSLSKEKTKGFFRRFFENLSDPIIKVLIFAVVLEVALTLGRCDLFEVFGIVSAILIATTVSTISEYGSERAFLKMQEDGAFGRVRVLRDGDIYEISVDELVVGDVVYLSAGEKIGADGYIISGKIKVDQSALNGESREAGKAPGRASDKWELSNSAELFRGTIITSGEGVMLVKRVGASTYYGMVAREVQSETRESPLKLRLAHFASQISKIGYVMAVVVALTYLFNTLVADNGFVWDKILASVKDTKLLFSTLIHALTLMITVVVVAAPEGLPMMITVVLSANMKKMLRDGVLVKKLVGIETAGSMNILFTDKTGTLTTGRLECDGIITQDTQYKSISAVKKSKRIYDVLCKNAKYNTEAVISLGNVVGGNGTDRAIASFFKSEQIPKEEIVEKIPFTSEKKYSAVKLKCGDEIIKGAPEIIIARSKYALGSDGEKKELLRGVVEGKYTELAKSGNRVIAVAIKEEGIGVLTFVALLVLKDKIRRGVRESVEGVKRAGVQVVMLTGDGRETATAIAAECAIMREGGVVLTSEELSHMSDGEIKALLPKLCVLARALPQDKSRLVKLSQELDLVVGMTGDGINDAPSLKLADVGFAMGNGQDIAKGAGDVILLDNSFLSINRTILYGRTIFKSIRKFITFQLVMNLVACGVSLVGQFLGIDSPITIIQMLWVNIIMDTLGGLAFSGEAPLEYYMKEKPKKRGEPILTHEMLHQIVWVGAYTLVLCIMFLTHNLFGGVFSRSDTVFMSAFYALFIFAGIFNCFGARCERLWILSNIRKNRLFIAIILLIAVIQILMIYFGGSLFRTTPLRIHELILVIALASSVVPFEIIRRITYKLKH